MLTNEIWIYEWTNVTLILHLLINLCVKCVFNARYQCAKHMNYEWTNFAWFSLLNCEMVSLWWSSEILLLTMQAWIWTMDYGFYQPWKMSNVVDIGLWSLNSWSPSLVAQCTTSDFSSSPMIHYSWNFFSWSFIKMQVLNVHCRLHFFSYHVMVQLFHVT